MLLFLALFTVASATNDAHSPIATTLNRRDVVSSFVESRIARPFGTSGKQSEILAGTTISLNGGGTHNFYGNIDNAGSIYVNQQAYLQRFPGTGGQTSDWVGHDAKNGNLKNRQGGLIQLNDIGSASAPTYDWYIRSFLNDGTIQWCGRGDTGGSTYQLYVDQDGINNGLISYEQSGRNLGASFVWRNPTLTTTAKGANIYNNGAFRLINVVYHNVQNVYGNGCWVIGQGGVLYLEDGTGVFQNPTRGPSFPQQSITFQDSTATLHMDTAVYSRNSDFGAQLHNFGAGNAVEFYETIDTFNYSEATGTLTVTMVSKNSVNIKLGLGYKASGFYQARNPQHYNVAGYNAVFYKGAAPSQSLPSQCSIGLSQGVCSGVPPLQQSQPPTTTTSLLSSSAIVSSTVSSSAISSKPAVTTSAKSSSASSSANLSTSSSPVKSSTTSSSIKPSSSSASSKAPSSSASIKPSSSTQSPKTTVTPAPSYYPPITSTVSVPQYGQITSTKTKTPWSTVLPPTTCSQACASLPTGAGPIPQPDTASAFFNYEPFHAMASAAPTSVHAADGGNYMQTFKDFDAAAQPQPCVGTFALGSYNTTECAAKCDSVKRCKSFNIYVEREPILCPAKKCARPDSSTFYMCTLWDSDMEASSATYFGQKVGGFEIVVTASNGYCKSEA